MAKIRYRLGLDVGANSIGWCVYRLGANDEPEAIIRMGSRIFSDGRDPKTLASNAAERRQARQARRRRDRLLKRRQRFMQALIAGGLMPADPAERKALQVSDPYVLRAKALDAALSPTRSGARCSTSAGSAVSRAAARNARTSKQRRSLARSTRPSSLCVQGSRKRNAAPSANTSPHSAPSACRFAGVAATTAVTCSTCSATWSPKNSTRSGRHSPSTTLPC